jgi:P27 family predicted phage terminase small subunit
MARPTKSIAATKGHFTKAQIEERKKQEEKLKGAADKVRPSKYLNDEQKKIFKYIVKEMEASGILSNLDVFVLDAVSIALENKIYIETMINEDKELLRDRQLLATKEKYTQEFIRYMNELSLSPQSRAKIGNLKIQTKQKEEDPLLKVLSGGKG